MSKDRRHGLDWFSPGRFALLLAVLVIAKYPLVALGLKFFVVRDFGFFAYPLAYFQRAAFWHGSVPLWNPYNDCGVPFLAQWNTMPLYPPALIYLVLPLPWSLGLFCLGHQWIAGMGAYFLARRWTRHELAAALAGVAFACNGMTLNLLMWPSHIATFCWMPWVVLLVERGWREGGRWLFLAALVGALQMLGGGPETILFTWLVAAGLWLQGLARGRAGGLAARGPALVRFPVIVLLVAALAAAQLLPFLELASHSERHAGFADSRWAMPLRGWANFFVPMAFGYTMKMGVFFQYGQSWTSSYYAGIAVVLLVLWALWRVNSPRFRLLVLAAGLALAFAFGDQFPPIRWLRAAVPQLALMTYPVKFALLISFLAPQLAAFGLARLLGRRCAGGGEPAVLASPEAEPGPRVRRELGLCAALVLVAIAGILAWILLAPPTPGPAQPVVLCGVVRAVFLILIGTVIGLLTQGRPAPESAGAAPTPRWRWRSAAPLALLLLAWLDVYTHTPEQNPTVDSWIFAPGLAREKLALTPEPRLGESRAMIAPISEKLFVTIISPRVTDDYLVKRLGYFADCNLLDGVPKVNGFFSIYPEGIGTLLSGVYGTTNVVMAALHDFMGVAHITDAENATKWVARPNYLPLITAGVQPVFVPLTNTIPLLAGPAFDPRKFVLLPPEAEGRINVTNPGAAQVRNPRFESERVECDVEAAAPALVVFAQSYYHCWHASVDDQPVPLWRANYAFQAVAVPAGSHRVRLTYEDDALRRGLWISAAAAGVCVVGLTRPRSKAGGAPGGGAREA